MTYVFPHVPKCGGTSLLKHIEESRLSTYIDYDAYAGKQMHRRNAEAAKLDFSAFDLIYGHFPIGRYRGNPKYRYIALVRDPVDRCVSHYMYAKWRWENGLLPAGHPASQYARRISEGELSLAGFIEETPATQTIYRSFLGHWDRSRFALVGRVERYDAFLSALSDLLGVKFTNDKRERESKEKLQLSDAERNAAHRLLSKEYAWYDDFIKSSV